MQIKPEQKVYIICFVFIALALYTFFWWQAYRTNLLDYFEYKNGFFPERDVPCISLVLRGELYQGQLACGQGPISYIIPAIAQFFFRDSLFSLGILLMLSTISFLIFLLLFFFLQGSILTLPFFFLIILPFAYNDFSSSLATLFVLYSLYTLTSSKESFFRYIRAGIFAGLALFTKTTILITFLALIPAFFITFLQNRNRQLIKNAGSFITGFIIISTLLLFLYPNTFIYSFLSHFSRDPATLSLITTNFVKSLIIGGEAFNLIFITLILTLLYCLTTTHTWPFLLLMSTIIPMGALNAVDTGGKDALTFTVFDYHLFPYFILFITGTFALYKQNNAYKILGIALLTLLWASYFAPQSDDAHYPFETPAHPTIPTNLFDEFLNSFDYSRALVDKGLAQKIHKPILKINPYNNLKSEYLWGIADTNYGEGIRKYVYDESKNKIIHDYEEELNINKLQKVGRLLLNDKLNLVAVGPYSSNPVTALLTQNRQTKETYPFNCIVWLPVRLDTEVSASAFFFFTPQDCHHTKQRMKDFFLPKTKQVCELYGSTELQRLRGILIVNNIINGSVKNMTTQDPTIVAFPTEIDPAFVCTTPDPQKTALETNHLRILFFLFLALSFFTSTILYCTRKDTACQEPPVIATSPSAPRSTPVACDEPRHVVLEHRHKYHHTLDPQCASLVVLVRYRTHTKIVLLAVIITSIISAFWILKLLFA